MASYSIVGTLALATALTLGAVLRSRNAEQAKLEYLAKQSGYDVEAYKRSYFLTRDLELHHTLSDSDWQEYTSFLRDKNADFRMRNATYLKFAKGGPHEDEAIKIARSLLSDSNEYVQVSMLSCLWRMKAADWHEQCENKLSSSSREVRSAAKEILAKKQ